MKKVEVIYTFDQDAQLIATFMIEDAAFNDKKTFFKDVVSPLKNYHKETLVKMSCCLFGDDIDQDHWFIKSVGKFWDDEIPQLMYETHGVKTTYTPINK